MSSRSLPLTALLPCLFFACPATAQIPAPPIVAPVGSQPASLQTDLSLRAARQFAAGDLVGAINTHLILEAALTGSARSANRDVLWQSLNNLAVDTDFSTVVESVARGWVELMQLARSGAALAAFEDWRRRYPDHPGESQIAAGLVTARAASLSTHGRIFALLLPMNGALAAAAKAIRAGAEAAQLQAGSDAPELVVHDTSGSLDAAIAAAALQGASAVIGPLRKEDVASLAARQPSLPTITLNYLDAGRLPPAGLIPFGLAPEDEARAAADHAANANLLRAVILAQEGDWGQRVAAAFKSHYEARGGTVLAQESFKSSSVDFTGQLKRLLGITYSDTRGKQLAAAGIKADLQPVPRGDIDAVYLAARSAQAKLIWPQMRYLRAGRIASYAPAAASDGGSKDLGRLMVCDAPWRIETSGNVAALRGVLASVNPRSADAQRLFALGFDAYELARRQLAGTLEPGESVASLTGALMLEPDGAIHRRLECTPLYAPSDIPDDPPE